MTISATTSTMSTMKRAVRTAAIAAAAVIASAACSSSQTSGATSSTTGSPASAAPGSGGAAGTATYQLHMDFFSHESKLSTVVDPQVFQASAGAAAGPGPQGISRAAGIAPTPKDAPAATTLLGADGTALNVSLGQWEKAAGTVAFSCVAGSEQAISQLSGLIPAGSYSTFVVHLDVQGKGRFTPWGDASGSTNNFTASASGTASVSNSVSGCLTSREAAVIIWHSDGRPHGAAPGVLGVTWHNSLITPLP